VSYLFLLRLFSFFLFSFLLNEPQELCKYVVAIIAHPSISGWTSSSEDRQRVRQECSWCATLLARKNNTVLHIGGLVQFSFSPLFA